LCTCACVNHFVTARYLRLRVSCKPISTCIYLSHIACTFSTSSLAATTNAARGFGGASQSSRVLPAHHCRHRTALLCSNAVSTQKSRYLEIVRLTNTSRSCIPPPTASRLLFPRLSLRAARQTWKVHPRANGRLHYHLLHDCVTASGFEIGVSFYAKSGVQRSLCNLKSA
jgi:hypothetical protein